METFRFDGWVEFNIFDSATFSLFSFFFSVLPFFLFMSSWFTIFHFSPVLATVTGTRRKVWFLPDLFFCLSRSFLLFIEISPPIMLLTTILTQPSWRWRKMKFPTVVITRLLFIYHVSFSVFCLLSVLRWSCPLSHVWRTRQMTC